MNPSDRVASGPNLRCHSHDEIVHELATMIAIELEVPVPEAGIGRDTPLFEGGLALDSFGIVDLIGRIESRFGILFADADLGASHFSVGTLATLVEQRVMEEAGE